MQREFSAGGVLVRRLRGRWMMAAIRPQRHEGPDVWALPKGHIDEGERIFKVVSFFLVRYEGGRLGDVPEAFRHEVAEARWLPLADAPRLLAYGGERDMAREAAARLANDPL